MILCGANDELPPWETLETEYGPMKIREFGPVEAPLAVLIHGMKDAEFIRNEWNQVAHKLAAACFHVIVPDFHSAPELLRPGRLTGEALRELFPTLCSRNHMIPSRYRSVIRPKAIIMGKSWGARMAAEVGALDDIVAVGLVTPSLGDQDQVQSLLSKIQGRVIVGLVADDEVLDFTSTRDKIKAASGGRDITWIEAPHGGHRVVMEFVSPLVDFAESARELFVHGGEL